MSERRILVRDDWYGGPFGLTCLGAALAAIAAYGWFAAVPRDAPTAVICAAAAALCVIAAVAWGAVLLRRRVWVRVFGGAFLVIDRAGEYAVRDGEVASLATKVRRNYSGGVLKAVTRTVTIRLVEDGADATPLALVTRVRVGESDPLAELLDRLETRLVEAAFTEVRAGRAARGEGWAVSRSALSIAASGGAWHEIPLSALDAADEVDGHVCVWARGGTDAAVRVPGHSPNARVLLRLAEQCLAERPARAATLDALAEGGAGGLNRVLFERRTPATSPYILGALAAAFGCGALGLFVGGVRDFADALPGLACVILAAGCVVGAVHTSIALFRCHEFGLRRRDLFGDRTLFYRDLDWFSWDATRVFVQGVYAGTRVKLYFVPRPDAPGGAVEYAATVKNADDALDKLRDRIAGIIAARMAERLASGESVAWTEGVRFLREGLSYQPDRLIGRGEVTVLPYDQIAKFHIVDGRFYLFARGGASASLSRSIGAPNFFPGLLLLNTLTEGTASTKPGQQPGSEG